jgi:dimethylaniline monooxygenase (N-oxide forming)
MTLNNTDNNLLQQLDEGKIAVKRGLTSFDGRTVTFADGSSGEYDAVVCCTGYKIGYPFLDKRVWDTSTGDNEVPLYKYMFPTNGYDNIAFIALVQPLGSMMMIAEMQTRVYASILAGSVKWQLPSKETMLADIDNKRKTNNSWYIPSPRHTIQVCVAQYVDELGEIIGVTPTVWRVLKEKPSALFYMLFCCSTNATYRLVGPGKWDGALDAIKREYNIVYARAPNRGSVKGWLQAIGTLCILIVLAFVSQVKNLIQYGKIIWVPWVY